MLSILLFVFILAYADDIQYGFKFDSGLGLCSNLEGRLVLGRRARVGESPQCNWELRFVSRHIFVLWQQGRRVRFSPEVGFFLSEHVTHDINIDSDNERYPVVEFIVTTVDGVNFLEVLTYDKTEFKGVQVSANGVLFPSPSEIRSSSHAKPGLLLQIGSVISITEEEPTWEQFYDASHTIASVMQSKMYVKSMHKT